jgi:hypothetical protein
MKLMLHLFLGETISESNSEFNDNEDEDASQKKKEDEDELMRVTARISSTIARSVHVGCGVEARSAPMGVAP